MLTPFALLPPVLAGAIVIDGRFDDWTDVPATLVDPADAPDAELDFGELRIAHDETYVHFLVEVGRAVNVQRLRGTLRLVLESEAMAVEFSPQDPDAPGRRGAGAAVRDAGGRTASPYDVGLVLAPTWASDRVELRMRRSDRLFAGGRVTGRLLYVSPDGTVADETDAFEHALTPAPRPRPDPGPGDPLAAPPGTDLRVVSWNAEYGAALRRPGRFGPVLRALDPDVVLWQELLEDDDPRALEALLDEWVGPPGSWEVLLGAGGGDLRCGLASRAGLEPAPGLRVVPFPDEPGRSLRIAAGIIERGRGRTLVVSVHLRCCGWAGSYEDRTRYVEADTLRRAVAGVLAQRRFAGLIVGGDLNLVGSRRPLEILAENLDRGRTDLAVAQPLQLDGRGNATWSDRGQPFVPGRLDFLLYSATALQPRRSFVLDPRDLPPRWRRRHGLSVQAEAEASDHLPVVVDFAP